MSSIVRTTDWETFTTIADVPSTATADLDERTTGSRTYLAGAADVGQDAIDAFLASTNIAADWFLILEDGTYVRILGEEAGLLNVDQSRETLMSPPEGGDPVRLRVVEPSPPTSPWLWFFDEVARAFADLNA